MKQLITLFTVLLFSASLFAQKQGDANYQKAMDNAIEKMETANSPDEYQAAANMFERISANSAEQWAPAYYLAFLTTIKAFDAKDKETASASLGTMTELMESKLKLQDVQRSPAVQSEIHALIAMMYSARMMADPMTLGAKYAPLNAEHLGKAMAMNAENPRAHLLMCQNKFYTPEAFGGDKSKAKLLAEECMPLFLSEAAKEQVNYMPRWGQDQLEGLLAKMK